MLNVRCQIVNTQNGFSLIELIVCLFIINLGMIGVLSLVLQNIKVESTNKNALIASQLAQEGLELVRNQRDNNWLGTGGWKDNIVNFSTYIIDYSYKSGNVITGVSEIDDEKTKLYINKDGYYIHESTSNSPTIFSRLISASYNDNDEEKYLDIKSKVYWKERGRDYNYEAEVYLYDWKQ
ncbi:MAG: prepilin-type N-terminal cleavage/methylation domain-containing protein [Patescibacteria group bacterium]